MDLKREINQINETISNADFDKYPSELYEPIKYILNLGGKRMRPLLTLFGCYLFSGDTKRALYPSIGIEIFHNFTLIHDDIMDDAPLRRGQDTVHTKWNDNVAILSGDTMLFRAYDFLIEVDDSLIRKVISLFNECAIEVCEGQQLDMSFESSEKVTEDQYIEMITSKTAVLLGFSLQLGALIGGADDENARILRKFGKNIGIGFQLKDDLLDVYGDASKFGKRVGGDIIANKKTYLLIQALNKANDYQLEKLQYWLNVQNQQDEKVKQITGIYDEIGINEITEKKIDFFFKKGFTYLERVECPEARKRDLIKFAESIMNREL